MCTQNSEESRQEDLFVENIQGVIDPSCVAVMWGMRTHSQSRSHQWFHRQCCQALCVTSGPVMRDVVHIVKEWEAKCG